MSAARVADPDALTEYKRILRSVLDQRPSGTRQRLAQELDKNRSFISQISNPAYKTPIPAGHLETIFEICHFAAAERQAFLDAYRRAHPGRIRSDIAQRRMRRVTIEVPDLGRESRNRELERLVSEFAQAVAHLLRSASGKSG